MSMLRFSILFAFCLCFLLSLPSLGAARPEMASKFAQDRFAAMDADKDGAVSRDEFFKAQPEMKEAAFEAIDLDKDGSLSSLEWEAFAAGHGRDGGDTNMPPHGPGISRNATAPETAPELIMPPKDGK